MPPKSKAQSKAAGMAVAMKKGEMPMKGPGPAASMAKSMSMKQAKEFASGPRKNLPNKVATKGPTVGAKPPMPMKMKMD